MSNAAFTGTINGTGTFTIASGVTLGGTGTYNTSITVQSGGTIAPGNIPGTISTGNLTLAAGATASMEIDGTVAGTGYDQIVVTGTVDVSGATLTTIFGYTSATSDSYILISNDGVDAVTGTFAGLAEGASFTANSRAYQISYAGGDGNDITVTDITSAPASPGAVTSIGGSDGGDLLFGTNSTDLIRAGQGADVVYALGGADTLSGGTGADTLYGHVGADLVYGNQGGDVVYGNQNTDTMYGGQDADTMFGGQDADVLYGNLGTDLLYGGQDADILYGGQDADTLFGNTGNDTLYGNLGADRFQFGAGSGADIIGDFSSAEGDVIAVAINANGTGVARAADLLARFTTDASGNALLDLGAGNSVTLIGINPASLGAGDFLLV